MKSFSIQNFGCRVNQAESFEWSEVLQAQGLKPEAEIQKSDLIIVNTCALTAAAERDVRKFFSRVRRENPAARLIVTGCAVELLAAELKQNSQVEAIFTNSEKELLAGFIAGEKKLNGQTPTRFEPGPRPKLAFRSRGLVKVQDGCEASCTFCLIPQLRGKSVSRPLAAVISRISELSACGYKEIVLAGIHLTSWGKDLTPPLSLLDLLREVIKIPGLGRLRLSSLDPRDTTPDLVDFICSQEKVCGHFHFALQHTSSRVLQLMGRRSSAEDYRTLLNQVREKSRIAALGADIIVGFPGEEEEDFLALYEFVAESPLTYLHVFPYSPRPGTQAAKQPPVPERIKKERAQTLRSLSRRKNFAFRQSLVGATLPAIVIRERPGKGVEVLTTNYVRVFVPGSWPPGDEVRVRVKVVEPEATWGEVVF